MRVIGVASDGLEAVLKTEALQPDLILLDIGLPKLNGIEAARRIRSAAPESKILFLSQEGDLDVARAALSAGGHGYVVKSDAEDELIAAIEMVMEGKRYVSRTLAGRAFDNLGDLHVADQLRRKELIAEAPSLTRKIGHRHAVQFYGDDASFADGFTPFISAARTRGMRPSSWRQGRTGIDFSRDYRPTPWIFLLPSIRDAISHWTLPKRFQHSWLTICLTRFDS